jgi:TolB-like protein/Tfp pilus assembly protein PilF
VNEQQWLATLAEAVNDGTAVDWRDAEVRASNPQARVIVEQLRVIAAISSVHRTADLELEPPTTTSVLAPLPPNVPPGARRWGALAILDEIGAGSYGRVYRALDMRLHREVALKLVRRTGSKSAAANLVGEARLLARVRHPHVVTVYGADLLEEEVGVWMELIHGRTLAALVAAQGPYGADEATVIATSLCNALSAVHQAGLLHRDVKAQNVMRESGGRIVLMDFGASLEAGIAARTGSATGTPLYLAPELLEGESATIRSDVYSLGVLLFFLVTARFPVEGTSIDELRREHRERRRRNLRDLRPNLPPAFVETVNRAIAPDPQARYASCGELAADLVNVLDPRAPAGPLAAGHTPVKRNWRMHVLLVCALLIALAVATWIGIGRLGTQAEPSLAVIPLRTLSASPGREYLADGLTDALIAHLTRIQGLRVLSYPAVASLRGSTETDSAAAKRLGVRYFLAGSVLTERSEVRTHVQLIDAATGAILWADEYHRTMSDVLGQQREIVKAVLEHLHLESSTVNRVGGQQVQTTNPDAHDAYLRGLAEESNGRMPEQAITHFERAVALEPRFADAWANLALARIRLANQDTSSDRAGEYERARHAAQTAIQLDPQLARAHSALATIRFYYDWDWTGAEGAFEQALSLNPGDAFGYQRYAMFLSARARHTDAIAMARRAQAIEPVVPSRSVTLGMAYYYARRYEESVRETLRALDFAPGYSPAHLALARTFAAMGRLEEAMQHAQKAVDTGNVLNGRTEIARLHALRGEREQADAVLATAAAMPQGQELNPDRLAYVHAANGDLDRAFVELDAAADRRAGNLLWIQVDARFDPFRNDPRFSVLLGRLNLR